jgi:CRP/FNR family cyclic AMP-dependent transcriptional regulator
MLLDEERLNRTMRHSMPARQISRTASSSINILKNIPFFASLSDKELSDLNNIISQKSFSRNGIILMEEDTPNYMYIIFSGKVKVVQVSAEGREKLLTYHEKGEFFGEMALVDGKTSPATIIAIEDTEIGLIHRASFETYLLKNEKVLRQLITMLCRRLRESWMMVKVLSFADAEQRVRATLKILSAQYGEEDARGTIITLRLTHRDIASYSSVSRETATRILDRFIKEGEVEIVRNRNILMKPSFYEKTSFL